MIYTSIYIYTYVQCTIIYLICIICYTNSIRQLKTQKVQLSELSTGSPGATCPVSWPKTMSTFDGKTHPFVGGCLRLAHNLCVNVCDQNGERSKAHEKNPALFVASIEKPYHRTPSKNSSLKFSQDIPTGLHADAKNAQKKQSWKQLLHK